MIRKIFIHLWRKELKNTSYLSTFILISIYSVDQRYITGVYIILLSHLTVCDTVGMILGDFNQRTGDLACRLHVVGFISVWGLVALLCSKSYEENNYGAFPQEGETIALHFDLPSIKFYGGLVINYFGMEIRIFLHTFTSFISTNGTYLLVLVLSFFVFV